MQNDRRRRWGYTRWGRSPHGAHHPRLLLRQLQGKQKHLVRCWGCQSSLSEVLICLTHPSIPVMPRSWFEEWETDWRILERAAGNVRQTLKAANHKDLHTCTFSLSWQDLIPVLRANDRRNLFSFPWKNSLLWCLFGFFCSSRLNILQLKVQSASL